MVQSVSMSVIFCLVFIVQPTYQKIPLDVSKKLADIKDPAEFARKMLINDAKGSAHPGGEFIFTEQGAINEDGLDVLEAMLAESGSCTPQPRSVTVPPDSDPNVIWWPSCVLLERCGGCCGNDLLECVPTQVETVSLEVMKAVLPFPGAQQFSFQGIVSVPMEKHTACDCHCREQAFHCTSLQEYVADICRCRCRNEAEATTCTGSKRWNSRLCACECIQSANDCTTTEMFNASFCRCESKGTGTNSMIDPCASTRCKAGFTATMLNNACTCTRNQG